MIKPLICLLPIACLAQPVLGQSTQRPDPADALTVVPQFEDADRFIALFDETGGRPSAAQLQERYIAPGSYGITVATPNRIVDADNLARAIAADPQAYRTAIDECLPMARASGDDLRAIYLGLKGALPQASLPQVYFIFGAGNSGGTAQGGAQVLGLEVLCQIAKDPDDFRRLLRHFYAHETIHSLQDDAGAGEAEDDYLLRSALTEGAADFIARLVTGKEPDEARDAWAQVHRDALFTLFLVDADAVRNFGGWPERGTPSGDALYRWVANYGSAPDGWPAEAGYWIGLKIWERYYAAAPDKHQALRDMLEIKNPREILAKAGY